MISTAELSKRLDVHPNTVRNWAEEYAPYLSPDATGKAPNAKRRFTDHDALVIATIADLRTSGLRHEQIVEALEAGKLVEALPDLPTREEEEARKRVSLVPLGDLQRALDQIRVMQTEIERLVEERDKAHIDRDAANQQIAELQHRIGLLEGQLSERLPVRQTLQIAAVFIIGLLALVLIVVVLLSNRPA